jgi:hypothetical protein
VCTWGKTQRTGTGRPSKCCMEPVYLENHTEYINTHFHENAEFLSVKTGTMFINHWNTNYYVFMLYIHVCIKTSAITGKCPVWLSNGGTTMDLGITVVRQSLIPRSCTDVSLYCHSLNRRGFILSSGTGNAFSTTSKVVLGSTQCIVSYLLPSCSKVQQGIVFVSCQLIGFRNECLVQ